MKIFIGVDHRQPLAYTVLRSSIERHASRPVDIQPLRLDWMPVKRRGLTDFTFSRYLVPWFCRYAGEALFMDADMLCLADIHELAEICAPQNAPVCVVKNPMLRFEWPSLMYFNNGLCERLTAHVVEHGKPQTLEWADEIGDIPSEWNHLVGYDARRTDAKVVHFTKGIPCWPETQDCEYAPAYMEEYKFAVGTVGWQELMGNSVHAQGTQRAAA